jgi:hypothetical protein
VIAGNSGARAAGSPEIKQDADIERAGAMPDYFVGAAGGGDAGQPAAGCMGGGQVVDGAGGTADSVGGTV